VTQAFAAAVLAIAATMLWLCCWRKRSTRSAAPHCSGKQIISPIPISTPPPTTSYNIPTHDATDPASADHSDNSMGREPSCLRAVSPIDFVQSRSDTDERSIFAAKPPRSTCSTDVVNPLAQLQPEDIELSRFSEENSSMSQQLDFMMSSMRSKIQTAVADMQAELQEELQEDDLKIHHVLGQGAFGTVYHGAAAQSSSHSCTRSMHASIVLADLGCCVERRSGRGARRQSRVRPRGVRGACAKHVQSVWRHW
jgi:hypothetical protein